MRLKYSLVGALAVVLTAGELSAFAQQRGDGQERGGRQAQPRAEQRDNRGDARRDGERADRSRGNDNRNDNRGNDNRGLDDRRFDSRRFDDRRFDNRRDNRNENRRFDNRPFDNRRFDNRRFDDRRNDGWRGNSFRLYSKRPSPRHYFGSGGNFSVYFGLGSGFRFGSPYRGRVYGYIAPGYGVRQYYGDVRLDIRPSNAAVYVDGYYAGIVDDFDGRFQSLTLTVGEHEIEVDAPGLGPRFFDVYVDPSRTVSLQADLFDPRW